MKIDDILEEFGEYVKIVEQPEYSKKALLDFQKRYQISTRLFYIASRLDFGKILAEIIPDYEDWLEHIHDYLKYGGDLSELDPPPISFPSCNNGQPIEDKKTGKNVPVFYFSFDVYNSLATISLLSRFKVFIIFDIIFFKFLKIIFLFEIIIFKFIYSVSRNC